MASKKIKIEDSKGKATQGEGKPELLRVEVGGLRAKSFQLSVGALEQALLAEFPAADAEEWDRTGLLVGDPAAPVRVCRCGPELRRRRRCGRLPWRSTPR